MNKMLKILIATVVILSTIRLSEAKEVTLTHCP